MHCLNDWTVQSLNVIIIENVEKFLKKKHANVDPKIIYDIWWTCDQDFQKKTNRLSSINCTSRFHPGWLQLIENVAKQVLLSYCCNCIFILQPNRLVASDWQWNVVRDLLNEAAQDPTCVTIASQPGMEWPSVQIHLGQCERFFVVFDGDLRLLSMWKQAKFEFFCFHSAIGENSTDLLRLFWSPFYFWVRGRL